jgi:hypothetical protein
MKCGVCQRDLSRDEAVYRVRTGYGSGVSIIVACSQCAKKWDREWYPAKLCCNCQRPTFVDHHRWVSPSGRPASLFSHYVFA